MSFHIVAKYNFLSSFLRSDIFFSRLNRRRVKTVPATEGNQRQKLYFCWW